ncbi:MAG: 30S ribosomal protein S8 [Candidatus Woesearchaeota archaeon]
MTMNDSLAGALSQILISERLGRNEVLVKPASKMIKKVLDIMNEHLYIGKYTEIQDHKGNILKISLIGKINKCGVVKPRYSVAKNEFEKFERRYLPAKGFGILIVSTPKGMMTHNEAKENKTGGRLIAYCY